MRQTLVTFIAVLFAVKPIVAGEPPQGFKKLFNGKDSAGWKSTGGMKVWGVENGVIYSRDGGDGTNWLMTEKEYRDFELNLEYKMPLKGNSGVGFRAPLKGHPAWVGLEVQLIDDINWGMKLEKWQNTGSIYDVSRPNLDRDKLRREKAQRIVQLAEV